MKQGKVLISESELKGIFKYYGIYSFLFILVNILLISIIAFFHFLLDHDMSVVENWLYRNNWEILVLCKLVALFSVIKILGLRIYRENFVAHYVRSSILLPKHYIFVAVFFLLSFILAFGKVYHIEDNSKYTAYHIISFASSSVYFLADYFLIFFLRSIFPFYKKWENYTFIFLSSFIFVSTSVLCIPHEKPAMIYLFFHFITMSVFTLSSSSNLMTGVIYSFFLISPLASLVGLDPVWGNEFSIFSLGNPLPFLYILTLWSISLAYLYFIKGKRLVD